LPDSVLKHNPEAILNAVAVSVWIIRTFKYPKLALFGSQNINLMSIFADQIRSAKWAMPKIRLSNRHVLEDTSHQTRPKIDASDASLLTGSIN
jgi:hypothetical protein